MSAAAHEPIPSGPKVLGATYNLILLLLAQAGVGVLGVCPFVYGAIFTDGDSESFEFAARACRGPNTRMFHPFLECRVSLGAETGSSAL